MNRRRACLALAGLACAAGGAGSAWGGSYDDFFLYVQLDRSDPILRLLKSGFDVNARDPRGQHAVYVGLREGSSTVVAALLDWPGLDPEATNSAGETLLMMASLRHDLSAMKRLAALGARINREGWTPLHYAASGGDPEAVAWLLERGAMIDAHAPNGSTPLMMAAGFGTIDAAELLLARGADVRPLDQSGRSAAFMARQGGFDRLGARIDELIRRAAPAR